MGSDLLASAPGIQGSIMFLSKMLSQPSLEVDIDVCRPASAACCAPLLGNTHFGNKILTCRHSCLLELESWLQLRNLIRNDILMVVIK